MNKPVLARREMRQYARAAYQQIFDENLYGANDPPPPGALRGIDVLPSETVRHKLSRAVQIAWGTRQRAVNLTKPGGFFEKLVLSKFFAPVPMPSAADKLACGAYVPEGWKSRVQPIPPIWHGARKITPDLIENLNLTPGTYYAKSNCGSGTNMRFEVPVSPRQAEALENFSGSWLKREHGIKAGEWWYGLIRPQNLIEADFAQPGESLTDWKFHCSRGRVLAVQVDLDRGSNHRQLMFDEDFNFLPENMFFKSGKPCEKPVQFDQMVEAARAISELFEFARVDLYAVGDKINLGEITLAPIGGQRPPISEKLDQMMGERWCGGLFG